MFFKKNKPSSSQPDEELFFSSTDPRPYPQGFSSPTTSPEREVDRLEAASALPPLSEAPASHQEPRKTSEDHLEDLWFRMSPPESESFELKADLDKPEFDFALDIDRSPDIDRAAGQLAEATQNIAPMEPIFDAAMPRESASPDWRVARTDSALFPEGSQANLGIAQPNVGLTGYGHLSEGDPWLDPVNRSLYPEGAFGGIESDLEAESHAFEEAARFLFPETVSAPLEWDMPQPGPEPMPMDPATLLGDNWETFSHEARGPVDLGPDFQAGARDLSDLSHQETTGEWSMFMAASSSPETQGAAEAPLPRPAYPLETPLTAGDFAPLSDQPPGAVDLESAWFMESPFPEAEAPLNAFASPFASHATAPAIEDLADQDFYVTEFTFDEEGALIPKPDETPDIFAEPTLTPLSEPEATAVWPKPDETPNIFAEPTLTPLSEPEATTVWPKTDKTQDIFAEPTLTPLSEPEARRAQPEPEKDFGPVAEPLEEMAIFPPREIGEETPDDQPQSQPQAQAEPEEPVWNFTETEPEEPSEKSCGAPSFDLSEETLPLEPIPAVMPLIAQAPFPQAPSPVAPIENHEAPPATDIKPDFSESLPEEHAERPAAPAIRLGNLEVLGICPVRPDCRLLIIHSNGAYALMSQLGREQPQISVLKLFEYNPIAYQSTFVAVENTPHPDRPGRFLVQVGLWRGMVSILKDQVALYRELG